MARGDPIPDLLQYFNPVDKYTTKYNNYPCKPNLREYSITLEITTRYHVLVLNLHLDRALRRVCSNMEGRNSFL